MKHLLRWCLLALPILFPLSLQAKTNDDPGQEKVCFCHNITHNPHTICTANPALIQAHMDHVNGEVPGVEDSLGACESEPDPSDVPDEGEEGEENEDPSDGGENPPEEDGNTDSDPKDTTTEDNTPENTQILDEGGTGSTGGAALSYMEGSGCSMTPAATGGSSSALTWALMAAFPLLWRRRRS